MMETLEITNFLTIRQANLEVRPFTIIIGPQANGKSVVAKLLYFCRYFLSRQFTQSIEDLETKRELDQRALERFEQIFPRYTWVDQNFEIKYTHGDIGISVNRYDRSSKKTTLKFTFSKTLSGLHNKVKNAYKRKQEESKESSEIKDVDMLSNFYPLLSEYIYNAPIGTAFQNSIFIPASRSFFATLQKNVFSFLANNISIDPLIKEFGSVYESCKNVYRRNVTYRGPYQQQSLEFRESIKQEIEKILTGQYLYESDQDWIVSGKRKINLVNASSGQQEVLPLLIVLLRWARYTGGPTLHHTNFFIEEPEAHLFPVSQRRLVGIFSKLYGVSNYHFLLTTHSPYVLTALNNLILASNIVEEKGRDVLEQVKAIINTDEMIRFVDVNAYTIQNGILSSIMDVESKLIGSSIIDCVSDEFDQVFGKLLELL